MKGNKINTETKEQIEETIKRLDKEITKDKIEIEKNNEVLRS